LRVSKQYRDTIEKWGEPNVIRKRTIIAPPMRDAIEKDVRLRPCEECKEQSKSEAWIANVSEQIESLFADLEIDKSKTGYDAKGFSEDYVDYQTWVEKEKKLRMDLNSIGFNTKWFMGKSQHTEVEKRVMERLQKKDTKEENDVIDVDGLQEVEPHTIKTPPPLAKSQLRLLPLLQQPIPVALSILAEYCYNKKLRLMDLYTQIDKDKDWLISREEVRKIVKRNEIPLTEAQLEDLIIALDVDNNDQLDYRELAQGVEAYRVDERWQKIRELMNVMEAYEEGKDSSRVRRSSSDSRLTQREHSKLTRPPARKSMIKDSSSDPLIGYHLQLPNIDNDDNTDSLASMARERRMRKHRDRKKRKQKEKQGKPKGIPPSTMEGLTGQLKDAYAEMIVNQVNQSLDLMHTNGIPVKEDAVRRVMLFPFDKSIEDCKSTLRQPGSSLISGWQLSNEKRGKKLNRRSGDAIQKRGRITLRERKRAQSPFWPDTTYSKLSVEQLGRSTPQESIFSFTKR